MTIIRDLTLKINHYLRSEEIILIIGARQSGKTTVLHQLEGFLREAKEVSFFLNLEDSEYLTLLNQSPKNIFQIFPFDLTQKNFLFVDEIQYLDNPSNFLKYLYDEYAGKIKIIASGSSAFYLDKKFKESLAGRKRIFQLYTLSFKEFLRFKDETPLAEKDFIGLTLSEKEKISLYYQEYVVYGGYPKVVLAPKEEKENLLSDLVYSYIKKDIFESGIRQDEVFYRLFKILASQTGNLVNTAELAATLGVSKTAIDNYLYTMQKSFHLALIRPFFQNIRKELTKMPKVYFLDLGLRNFFCSNFNLFETRDDKGPLLENAVFRQLLEKYPLEEIKFWRTTAKQEVDFIAGENSAFEVKSQAKNVRRKDYQTFLENYPKIKLSLAVFQETEKKSSPFPVYEVWQLPI